MTNDTTATATATDQSYYTVFILRKDALSVRGVDLGPEYKAIGVPMVGGLPTAYRSFPGRHALGIHLLRNRGSGLVAMAYRTETIEELILRDYPDVMTDLNFKWLGLEDYDEAVKWVPEEEWSVYRLTK
jgi:hypothetical protein